MAVSSATWRSSCRNSSGIRKPPSEGSVEDIAFLISLRFGPISSSRGSPAIVFTRSIREENLPLSSAPGAFGMKAAPVCRLTRASEAFAGLMSGRRRSTLLSRANCAKVRSMPMLICCSMPGSALLAARAYAVRNSGRVFGSSLLKTSDIFLRSVMNSASSSPVCGITGAVMTG
jgi:hypothetical protein